MDEDGRANAQPFKKHSKIIQQRPLKHQQPHTFDNDQSLPIPQPQPHTSSRNQAARWRDVNQQ